MLCQLALGTDLIKVMATGGVRSVAPALFARFFCLRVFFFARFFPLRVFFSLRVFFFARFFVCAFFFFARFFFGVSYSTPTANTDEPCGSEGARRRVSPETQRSFQKIAPAAWHSFCRPQRCLMRLFFKHNARLHTRLRVRARMGTHHSTAGTNPAEAAFSTAELRCLVEVDLPPTLLHSSRLAP